MDKNLYVVLWLDVKYDNLKTVSAFVDVRNNFISAREIISKIFQRVIAAHENFST